MIFKLFQSFLRVLFSLNERGVVPSSLTDSYDALLTTTLRNMQPRIHDNISRGSTFLNWLNSKGRWTTRDGGERVKVGLMHAQNSGADIYSGYGQIDTSPTDGITSAFYEWAQLACPITISRKEERQNSGRSRILSLLEQKTSQSMVSIKELLNNSIVSGKISSGSSSDLGQFIARTGRLDTSASAPLPLTALIDATNSRSVAVGNINPNTHSFWRNQSTDSAATTFAGLKQDMLKMYDDCSKGAGGTPDLLIGDQIAHEQYFNALQNQERYVVDDARTIDVLGGSEAIKFRRAAFIWDEVVPDVKTNADVVDSVGTRTLSTIYFTNSESIEFIRDSGSDFITTPFVRPENQDAKVALILFMGATALNNRRKNGVLMGISQSITS